MAEIRQEFDVIDRQVHELLSKRCALSLELGRLKKQNSLNIIQPERRKEILENRYKQQKEHKVDNVFITRIYDLIHEESVKIQQEEFNK